MSPQSGLQEYVNDPFKVQGIGPPQQPAGPHGPLLDELLDELLLLDELDERQQLQLE